MVLASYNLSTQELVLVRIFRACWLDILAEWVDSRFSERPCVKNKGRDTKCQRIYMHIHMNVYTHDRYVKEHNTHGVCDLRQW